MRLCALVLLNFFLAVQGSIAQSSRITDSLIASADLAIQQFINKIGHNLPLYCGSAYVAHGQDISGSAYFDNDSLARGSIFFDGVLYPDLTLGYDLVTGDIVIRDYTNNLLLQLPREKVLYFSINTHLFVSYTSEADNSQGYMESIYTGPHALYADRRRQVSEKIVDNLVQSRYRDYNTYYLRTESGLERISRLSILLRHFGNQQNDIRKKLRTLGLQFRKEPEKTLVMAAQLYDRSN